jgi:KamA family protein
MSDLHYKYQAYSLHNYRKIPQVMEFFTSKEYLATDVTGQILPFKVSNYVINELIDWNNIPHDPIFRLTFPQAGMLKGSHFREIQNLLSQQAPTNILQKAIHDIRLTLNPHPAGQLEDNIPELNGEKLSGVQHKYEKTMLLFPPQGQTCHAYCTFCFRWPQFTNLEGMRIVARESEKALSYLQQHQEISDVLITGGDPLIMPAKVLRNYLEPILYSDRFNHVRTIRIGSKTLSYWPWRYLTDPDSADLLALFTEVTQSGRQLAFMAHFNHPAELKTHALREAVKAIRSTGAQIRTQSPLLRHINDNPDIWAQMWQRQVELGMIPYYMFLARDTGAQHYFAVPLVRAWRIFRQAYNSVSGIARTVRGPSMSAHPGKIQLNGISEINGKQVMSLQFIQARNPELVGIPFFAQYDPEAIWLDDLKPAFKKDAVFERIFTEQVQVYNHTP